MLVACSVVLLQLQLSLALNMLASDEINDVLRVQAMSQGVFGRRLSLMRHDVLETAESATPPEIFQVVAGIPQNGLGNPVASEILKNYGKASKKKSSVYKKPLVKTPSGSYTPELLECDNSDQTSESSQVSITEIIPTAEQNAKRKRSSESSKLIDRRRANIIRSLKKDSASTSTSKPYVSTVDESLVARDNDNVDSSLSRLEDAEGDKNDNIEEDDTGANFDSEVPSEIIKTVHFHRSVISHSVFPGE